MAVAGMTGASTPVEGTVAGTPVADSSGVIVAIVGMAVGAAEEITADDIESLDANAAAAPAVKVVRAPAVKLRGSVVKVATPAAQSCASWSHFLLWHSLVIHLLYNSRWRRTRRRKS